MFSFAKNFGTEFREFPSADSTPTHLTRAKHVYLRVGEQQKLLVVPYGGPYTQRISLLKGLSYEIDFENVDEN
jgi:hypothetical protein